MPYKNAFCQGKLLANTCKVDKIVYKKVHVMSIKMLVDFHEDFKKTIQTDAEIWRTKDWENEKPRETNIDIGGTIYVRSLWTAEIHV